MEEKKENEKRKKLLEEISVKDNFSQKPKFKPDTEAAIKHQKIMRGFRPTSEMPGNDR